MRAPLAFALVVALFSACSSSDPVSAPGAKVSFDFGADLTSSEHFYDAPYPSDLRLLPNGAPDVRGMPIPLAAAALVEGLKKEVGERKGFPVLPVAYFHFEKSLAPRDIEAPIAASFDSPVVLVDVDDASPERGALIPTVATAPAADGYVPEGILAVAARPGFVLHPKRRYAFVVFREMKDADGLPLGADDKVLALVRGQTPSGARGAELAALYAPLARTLDDRKVDLSRVAAATVFTTGDVVSDTFELSERVKAKFQVEIKDLHVDPDDGAAHPGYCELIGTVTFPQFQKGTPPFNTDGLFDLDADGLPNKQRDESSPVTLTIPKNLPIAAAGLPLVVYFHGSGGVGAEAVDSSRSTVTGQDGPKGEGPASFVAPHGMAMIAASLPFSVERFASTDEQSYLNLSNLAAFRDTFRQGMLEQRMFLEAAKTLRVPLSAFAACTGMMPPAAATDVGFDPEALVAMGQSMGGAYTNYLSALDPRVKAAVPTGAGGYWSRFVLDTPLVPNAAGKIGLVLATSSALSFAHPALNLLETAWEPVEPLAYVPRIAQRPLPGHPTRPIYEPVGKGDVYFPIDTYDAVALAYGNEQAGDVVWPSMQDALALANRGGVQAYPVSDELTSETGVPYTGVVVQYAPDGIANAHQIYRQLDAVKYQYGCFLETFLKNKKAVVPAPAPLGTPCPE